jgi:hypothetical protein
MFDPKKEDRVFVCYDGKWGRRQVGRVIKRRGFAVQVEFPKFADNNHVVTNWFVRISPQAFGGYVRSQDSLMKMMFKLPGDWYSVFDCNVGD